MTIRTQINGKLLSCLDEPAKPPLKTCIPVKSRFYNLTRLSLAEYSLYSGFVVLTPLQVLTVVMGIGLLSPTPRCSEMTLEDHVKGKMWFLIISLSLSTVWNFIKNSVIFPLLICELFVNFKLCNILFSQISGGC